MNREYRGMCFIITLFLCFIVLGSHAETAFAATLKLPSALTTIEVEAFYGDNSIDIVQLPDTIERIESKAFANSSLQEINLPDSLRYIADDAFSGVTDISVSANEGSYAYRWADSNGLIYHPVTGISLDKSEYTAYIDITYKIDATIYPENATNKQIKWSSSNPNIITVDEKSGQIRHKQTGTATLTATTVDGGFTASCIVTGVQPPTGIDINKQVLTLVVGSTEKLIKTVHPENVYRPDSVTWTSSNPSIATVDSTGKVTAISAGTANISVKTNDRGYTASCTVTVKPAIKVTGGTKRTGIVCRNMYITSDSAWTAETTDSWLTMYTTTDYSKRAKTMSGSAGTDVAAYVWLEELPLTIASRTGKITFRNADSSYILDIVQDRTDAPMTGVSFKSTSGTLAAGETMTLIPTFEPSYATDRRVTWSSNNTAIATVDANGNVKGIAPGTAKITVKTTDGGFTAEYTVVVNLEIIGGTKNEGVVCRSIRGTATSSWTATVDVTWIKINSVYDLNSASSTISGNATSELTCYAWLSELPLTVASRTGHIVFRCENSTYTLDIVQDRTDAPMTGVSFSPTSGTIAVGEMKTLIPTFAPSYATDRRVTWSSNNTAIATVDANGNVKGIAPGTAKITVKTTDGGFTAVYTVTVVQLHITPTYGIMSMGSSVNLHSSVLPATLSDFTTTWTSSDPSVLRIDTPTDTKQSPYIKVTGLKAGTSVVTGTTKLGGATCTYTVTVVSVALNKTSTTINVGNSETLTATVAPGQYAGAANSVTWTSSNNNATVDSNGKVTAKSPGTVTITATSKYGNAKESCSVTVNQLVTDVSLDSTSVSMNVNDSTTVNVTSILPGYASNKILSVSSNNTGVASVTKTDDTNVTKSFTIKAVAAGKATINVKTTDGSNITRTCEVTVEEPISFSPAFNNLNGSNYAITYLVNEYSHYAYSANTFTGTQVEVMPSTELKLYAVGTNSNGESYAKIVYNGQTLYIPMWKVVGNWTGGAWTAQSSVNSTYMYPGGARAGSIDIGDTVYTLQESNGWRQVMYNLSGSNNWKIAWYLFSEEQSVSVGSNTTGRAKLLAIIEEELNLGIGDAELDSSNSPYYNRYGNNKQAWCGYFAAWCLRKAGMPVNESNYPSAPGWAWELAKKGKFILTRNDITGFQSSVNSAWGIWGLPQRIDYVPNPGDIMFLKNDSTGGGPDHIGIVWKVASDGRSFTTVEGNVRNGAGTPYKVRSFTYTRNSDGRWSPYSGWSVMGFGIPD